MHSAPPKLLFMSVAAVALLSTGCGERKPADTRDASGVPVRKSAGKIDIAMLPKLINIDYFDACKRGGTKAAEEIVVLLNYVAPTQPAGSEQHDFVDTWISQGVQASSIAPIPPKTIRRFVEKSHAQGIKGLTCDSGAPETGRDLFVNQVDEKAL